MQQKNTQGLRPLEKKSLALESESVFYRIVAKQWVVCTHLLVCVLHTCWEIQLPLTVGEYYIQMIGEPTEQRAMQFKVRRCTEETRKRGRLIAPLASLYDLPASSAASLCV